MRELSVCLRGALIGYLRETRKGARFHYCDSIVLKHPGVPLLSVSLPVRAKPFSEETTRNWFEGLLPEGQRRDQLCRAYGIPTQDWVGLLALIGWECAGAVQLFEGDKTAHTSSYRKLDEKALLSLLHSLDTNNYLRESDYYRMSLGGFQDKICLAMKPLRSQDSILRSNNLDIWLPEGETASTHILKPEPALYPGCAEAEAWALLVASKAARAAKAAILRLPDYTSTLVVERFDRERNHQNNEVIRLHQEDVCQALNLPGYKKYADEHEPKGDDPTYKKIAAILMCYSSDPHDELLELLRQMTVTVAIGNWDCHAKNVTLLYKQLYDPVLSPLYDVLPIANLEPRTKYLPLRIDNEIKPENITGQSLINEAASWGIKREDAIDLITETFKKVETGIEKASDVYPAAGARYAAPTLNRVKTLTKDLPARTYYHGTMMAVSFPASDVAVDLTHSYLDDNEAYQQEKVRVNVHDLKAAIENTSRPVTVPAPAQEKNQSKVYVEFQREDVQEHQNSKGETLIRMPKDPAATAARYSQEKKAASFGEEEPKVDLTNTVRSDGTRKQEKTKVKTESLKKGSTL